MLSRPISGSGGVSTGLYRVINVKDYGATGNGVTDDTAAIGTAIAALGTYLRLFFPAGTYIVNSQVAIAVANATVFGEGRFASVIKLKNSSAITAGQSVLLLSAAGIAVEDLGIEGNSANNSTVAYRGIRWLELNDITIQRVSINAVTDIGILIHGTITPNLRNKISNCQVNNSGNVGIALYYGKDCKITKNTSVSSGSHGILVTHGTTAGTHNSEKNLVQGNTVNRATPPTVLHPALGGVENGFLIALDTGADNTTVDGNHCWDNRNGANDGIGLGQDGTNDPKGTVITNNIVGYAGLFGIDATNQSIVSNNYVYRPKYYGITAVIDLGGTLQDVTISDNIVIDPMYGGNVGYSAGIVAYSDTAGGQIKNLKITDNTVRNDSVSYCQNGVHLVSGNATFTDVEVAHNNLKNIAAASVTLTGTAFTNLMVKDNVEKTPFRTFTNADTTPTVLAGEIFKCSNTGATTITAFDNGYTGQEIEVVFTTSNTTINETGNIKLQGADAINPAANDVYRFRFDGTSWFQVGGGTGGNDVDGGLIGESDISGQTVDGGSL